MLLLALLACGQQVPTSLAGCADLASAAAREDCRLQYLEPLFVAGDLDGFEEGVRALESPISRDLVRLRLAVRAPDRAGALCAQVETEGARDKCRQVLGRPHLAAPRP
jgi:hypothetical protein